MKPLCLDTKAVLTGNCLRGASAAFFVTAAAKETGFGSTLNVGLCYGLA